MSGAMYMGIDFAAIEPCMRLMGIKKKKWRALFDSLVAMSEAAATVINDKQKANQ